MIPLPWSHAQGAWLTSGWETSLDMRHLAAFVAVCEEGTFGRAAARLGYTQSAVSQQIAGLERIVGTPLFERPGGPRRVTTTPAGERLLSHAVDVLGRVRLAELDLRDHTEGRVGRLTVGTFQSVSVRILPGLLGRLRTDHPAVEVELVEQNFQDRLLGLLASGDIDLAFVVLPLDPFDHPVGTVALLDDPYVVLDQEATPSGVLDLVAIEEAPLVGLSTQTCQVRLEAELHRHGLHPRFGYRFDDNVAVQAMVRNGMGRAVMPLLAVDAGDPRTALLLPDPPLPPRRIGIAFSEVRRRPPVAEVFIGAAAEECARIAADSASAPVSFTVPAP